ncbi:hypothetical protein KJ359_013102 [Pestalotiopsis sp. 9143b]|nr:hypothetical protein KJ359_013102 [Pestalotiopsis sp. 9143b]
MASFEQEDDRALEFFQFEVPGQKEAGETHSVAIGDLYGPSPPLIVLHDGPGTGFEYLHPLIEIWKNRKIPLIFYDQIGCGQSTHYPEKMGDESFWTLELYINQLENLIDNFGLAKTGFHLLGHGWGGMLAGEFASRRPRGLKKLIIASGPASMPLYVEGLKTLLASLPGNDENKLADYLKFDDDHEPEVLDLLEDFTSRHNYREPGAGINRFLSSASTNIQAAPEAYLAIMGPLQFDCIGSFRDWEARDAHRITVQTLLVNGKHDFVTSTCMEPWLEKIPNVEWTTFEESSHQYQWEEAEAFIDVIAEFLETKDDAPVETEGDSPVETEGDSPVNVVADFFERETEEDGYEVV